MRREGETMVSEMMDEKKTAPAVETQERRDETDRPVGYDAFSQKSIEQISQAIGLTASRDTCG